MCLAIGIRLAYYESKDKPFQPSPLSCTPIFSFPSFFSPKGRPCPADMHQRSLEKGSVGTGRSQ